MPAKKPDLPPELSKLRELDEQEHIRAAEKAGLDPSQAKAHAHDELGEGLPGDRRDKKGK